MFPYSLDVRVGLPPFLFTNVLIEIWDLFGRLNRKLLGLATRA